jgi:hypothetical protein
MNRLVRGEVDLKFMFIVNGTGIVAPEAPSIPPSKAPYFGMNSSGKMKVKWPAWMTSNSQTILTVILTSWPSCN